jgi:hypothetical protein
MSMAGRQTPRPRASGSTSFKVASMDNPQGKRSAHYTAPPRRARRADALKAATALSDNGKTNGRRQPQIGSDFTDGRHGAWQEDG